MLASFSGSCYRASVTAFTSFLLTIGLSTPAFSDLIFSIDLDTTLDGIQSRHQASPGAIFEAYLNLSLSGDTRVAGYSVSIEFNPVELDILDVDDSYRPDGWFSLGEPIRNESASRIELINASNFSGSIGSGFSGPIARLTLQVRDPSLSPSAETLSPGFFHVSDGIFDGSGDAITSRISFVGGTVTAVPEPSSTFMAISLLGLWALRRRRILPGSRSPYRMPSEV